MLQKLGEKIGTIVSSRETLAVIRCTLVATIILTICRWIFFRNIPYVHLTAADTLLGFYCPNGPSRLSMMGAIGLLVTPLMLRAFQQDSGFHYQVECSLINTSMWVICTALLLLFDNETAFAMLGMLIASVVCVLICLLIIKGFIWLAKHFPRFLIRYLKGEDPWKK